jgi:subfamily B ATP-binding cassette protein MsbA
MLNLFDFFNIANSETSIFLFIIISFFFKGLLLFCAYGLKSILQALLTKNLKYAFYRGYSNMTYKYYLLNDTGELNNLMNEQINRSVFAFNNLLLLIVKFVNSFMYLSLALFVSWQFGFLALIIGFSVLTLFQNISGYVRKMSRLTTSENGKLSKIIIEILHSFKYLKATETIKSMNSQVLNSINILSKLQQRHGIAYALTSSFREPIIIICIVLILYLQFIVLNVPIAPSLVSIALFYRALNTLIGLQNNFQSLLEFVGSVEIVDEKLNLLKINEEKTAGFKPVFNEGIKFENVYFSYADDKNYVLKKINLDLPPLKTVAIVGASGAGKSTLIDLFSYTLKPNRGNILIDNKNIKNIDLKLWRSKLAYVSQDTAIFDDTVLFNICLEKESLNKTDSNNKLLNKVTQAAKQAYIHDFIDSLPDGYNTIVGERGIKLSGGQKQRLFIARELYRKPKILILDEATSSLDSKSEMFIKESIDLLRGKTTVLIIAHRLSTIKNVDYVYVLDKGEIIEHGEYKLLRSNKNSQLSKLISLQEL